jgi:hypothetical protein
MSDLLRRLLPRKRRNARPADVKPRPRSRFRLRMEGLEERVAPAVYTVNAITDTGTGVGLAGDLRYCINQANASVGVADTIVFDPTVFATPQTINTTATLTISDPLTIAGTDPNLVTVRRNSATAFRIFTLTAAAGATTLAGMTITGGNSGAGAGINASTATLTVNNCVITGNTGTGEGGAIYLPTTTATLSILNSTISGNTALQGAAVYFFIGGGLNVQNSTISGNSNTGGYSGGTIYFWGSVSAGGFTISNSTIANNTTPNNGGAICFINFTGTANINNSTITGNSAGAAGGGIARRSGTGTVNLSSTILAQNTNTANNSPDANVALTANFSLIGNTAGTTVAGANNILNVNPQLGPLQINGGTVQTRMPLVGSPVIDAGINAFALTSDERGSGFSRTFDDPTVPNAPGSDGTDIGAVEKQPIHPIATAAGPNVTVAGGTSYTFTVTYTGIGGFLVDRSTIDSNDILVTGPNAFSQVATLVGTAPASGNATTITATYSIVPPGGAWNGLTGDGTYTFNMQPNQVFDTQVPPQPVPPGPIGTFNVLIPLSLVVTNAHDSGPGSLRDAVNITNSFATSDTITFDPTYFTAATPRTITLSSGELKITDNLIINGPGANAVTVSGNDASRVFDIDDGKATSINVTLSGLTVSRGKNFGPGGGIFINNEHVTLVNSVVSGNNAATDFNRPGAAYLGYGGGIAIGKPGVLTAGGTLTVQSSVITGNGAEKAGGGICVLPGTTLNLQNSAVVANSGVNGAGGGGIAAFGSAATVNVTNSTVATNVAGSYGGGIDLFYGVTATITNSTISGNSASFGGGLFEYYSRATVVNSTVTGNRSGASGGGLYAVILATLTVQNSTITGNTASGGPGIFGNPGNGGGIASYYRCTVNIASTIAAKNSDANGTAPDIGGAVNATNSLIGTGVGATISGSNNIVGNAQVQIDPLLGPLQNNGGPTQTMAPLPQSAAAVATLKAAVLPATTTFTVSSAAPFIAGQYLLIDSEEMRVVSVNLVAGTVTVTRGVKGTTAAAHAAGVGIFLASPIIDNGSNPTGLTTDQRGPGFARTVGTATDIGAVEFQPILTPTVTINQAVGQPDPTNTLPITFAVAFNTPVSGFSASGVTVALSAGLTGTPVVVVTNPSGDSKNFTVTVSGISGSGTVTASVPAGAATSFNGGQPNLASTSTDNVVTFDNVAPFVTAITLAPGQTNPANALPIVFAVTFSEPLTTVGAGAFTNADVQVTATGALTPTVTVTDSGDHIHYTVSVNNLSPNATITNLTIPANTVTDLAGNPNVNPFSYTTPVAFTPASPGVTINQAAGQPDPTNQSPIRFTVVFSRPVQGFTGAGIDFTGSTAPGTLVASVVNSGDNIHYTVTVTGMTGSGHVVASVKNGAATAINDGSPNVPSTSTDNDVNYDVTAPTVTVTAAATQNDPTNASPIVFTVTFSKPVSTFDQNDVQLSGSAFGGGSTPAAVVTQTGPTTYSVSVTGMNRTGAVTVTIPPGVVHDLAGNFTPGGAGTVGYDITAPTVTINQGATQNDPTNAGPIVFDVAFSEPVTGFRAIDVILGGTAGATTAVVTDTGDHIHYTVAVTGMAQPGTVTATVRAGAARDLAGNLSLASTSTDNTVTFDTTSASVTINQAAGQNDPTRFSPILFDVVFSKPVNGLNGSSVTLGGTAGPTTAVVTNPSNDRMHFVVSVSGMARDGTVTATVRAGAVKDDAGNPNLASTSTDNTVTFDTTAPSVTINQGAGQVDPTNQSPVVFDVTFSEPVFGFSSTDVTLSGTAGATTAVVTNPSNDNQHFVVTVSGMVGSGTVTASIPAGAVVDLAGNASLASTSTDNTVTFDTTAPIAVITANVADPTNKPQWVVTVTFSKPVFGFDQSDLTVSNGTATGFAGNPGGTVYSFALTPTNQGLVTVSIPGGAAQDAAGNGNIAPPVFTRTFDTVAPTVVIGPPSVATVKSGDSVSFTVTYADLNGVNVTLTPANVILNATGTATATVLVSGSGNTRTVTLTNVTGDGTLGISLPAGTATDAAGNPAPATPPSAPVTATAPAVTGIAANGAPLTNAAQVSWTVTFSQPVTGLGIDNFTLIGSGAGGAQVVGVRGSGTTYTVDAATGADGRLTLVFSNPAGIAPPVGGTVPFSGQSYTVSKARPVATVTSSAPPVTSAVSVPVFVSFSKPVTGFSAASLVLTNAVVSGFSGAGTDYSFFLRPTGQGPFGVVVPDGAGVDAAGNPSVGAALSRVSDNGPPSVEVEQAPGQADPADLHLPVVFAATFSEPVHGFGPAGVIIGGTAGATTAAVADSGDHVHYTVVVTGMTQAGTVAISLASGAGIDAAGNPSFPSFSADNVVTVTGTGGGPGGKTIHLSAIGADASGGPHVKVFNADGSLRFSFFAYDASFTGGVRVATGDVNGDGMDDVITAAGPSGGPQINVYDGRTGQLINAFFAYSPLFTGGVFVAAGDVNGDGHADIITGADAGGGPHVQVFDGVTGNVILSFMAYSTQFTGGVRVAAGDVNGDGKADIITGAGPGGGPHVQVFRGFDGLLLNSFFAFDPGLTTGLFVAAGDINGSGRASVVAATGASGSRVRAFDGLTAAMTLDLVAFPGSSGLVGDEFSGFAGVRVGVSDFNGDGRPDILVVTGPGVKPTLRVFDGITGALIADQGAYDPAFLGGIFVS